jgi:hypothetical protein
MQYQRRPTYLRVRAWSAKPDPHMRKFQANTQTSTNYFKRAHKLEGGWEWTSKSSLEI